MLLLSPINKITKQIRKTTESVPNLIHKDLFRDQQSVGLPADFSTSSDVVQLHEPDWKACSRSGRKQPPGVYHDKKNLGLGNKNEGKIRHTAQT